MENDDYIDTVVIAKDQDDAGKRNVPVVKGEQLARASDFEISSLTIDETTVDDTNPYNSTGKHCVLKNKR